MGTRLRFYLSFQFMCWFPACKGSWNLATGFGGALVAGALMIRSGVIEFFDGSSAQVHAWNVLVSFVVYTVAAWLLIILLRVIFVSPFQLYQRLKAEKDTLEAEVKVLRLRGVEPVPGAFDLSAAEVAAYVVQELAMNLDQATEFVRRMAYEERLQVRGIKDGNRIDAPVPCGAFAKPGLDLVADLVVLELLCGADYYERTIWRCPRFVKTEVKDTVRWYRHSRPTA